MRIRTLVFLGFLLIATLGLALLMFWASRDLGPQYRKATEEPLVDISRILASIASLNLRDGQVDVGAFKEAFEELSRQSFSARIYDFTKVDVDMRVYITDARGIVLYDSFRPANVGLDYSKWNDVARTLAGQYGARATRDNHEDPRSEVMYIAAPITSEGRVVGVLSVGKPVRAANAFIVDARRYLVLGLFLVLLAALAASAAMSHWLAGPIDKLVEYARKVRHSKGGGLRPPVAGGEVGELGVAFQQMSEALEGRRYVEHYVQGLTHEIKGPLSAIAGAAELLEEEGVPQERRAAFLANIQIETQRIRTSVDKLLLLSSLETHSSMANKVTTDLRAIAAEAVESLKAMAGHRKVTIVLSGAALRVEVDEVLLRQALMNLIQNAVEFSDDGGRVEVEVAADDRGMVRCEVRDQGPGVPDYALGKVFDRFYSLKRPASGRKSSGLGLTLVREIAELHGGTAGLENQPGQGARATLMLPAAAR